MKIRLEADMLKGNILKALLLFAIPLFISSIFQQLYDIVNTIVVGNFLGERSLAAIGASVAINELLIGFALGVGNGFGIVTARSYGAGDEELLKKSVAGSIIIGLAISIVITLLSRVLLYPLLELLQTPENIIGEAHRYISIMTLFVTISFTYNLCAGLLRAIGNSVMPLVFLIISSILNVLLGVTFVVRLGYGLQGAAVATVISQTILVILCFVYIYKKAPILIPKAEHFKISKELFLELLTQGLSMGLMVGIVSVGTVILQFAINGFGYLIIAGHIAARRIGGLCSMPMASMALALSTFVSQNKGAGQSERIGKGVRYANLFAIFWGIIVAVVLFFIAPTAVRLFSGSVESDVIENGAMYLRMNAPFYMVLGLLLNLRNSLQGIGRKFIPLISSIIELIVKILFVINFIPKLNYFGVIICEPVIWCLMCAQLAFSYYQIQRKEIEQEG